MTKAKALLRFSRRRVALPVLLGDHATITAILCAIVPLTAGWDIWQRTLRVAPATAAAMVWASIPAIQQRSRAFVDPRTGRTA